MDYEEVGNFSNLTFEENISPNTSTILIIQEVVFSIITLIALFLNVITIYTIFRYSILRNTPNYIIVNWALSDCLAHLTTPSIYRIMAIFGRIWIPIEAMCIIMQFTIVAYTSTNLFVALLALDWCFAACLKKQLQQFRSYFKYYIVFIWGTALLILFTTIGLCITKARVSWFQYATIFTVYSCVCVFTVVLQLKRVIDKLKRRSSDVHSYLMLNIASVFVVSWSVGFISIMLVFITEVYNHVIEILAYCFIYGTSIFTFAVMYSSYEDFNACIKQVFKRRNKYEEMEFT